LSRACLGKIDDFECTKNGSKKAFSAPEPRLPLTPVGMFDTRQQRQAAKQRAKTVFFEPVVYKNEHVTKAGSGQT
jgi:hypothetical protein